MPKKIVPRISVDFDGVIHKYSKGFQDGSIYDKPMDGAIDAIKRLQKFGFEVVILTAKTELGEKRNKEIRKWLKKYGLDLKISNTKMPSLAYIDNRGIRFTSWNDIVKYFT